MTKDELKALITSKFAGRMTELDSGRVDLMYEVSADNLLEVCRDLRDDEQLKFDFFCNLGAVDTGEIYEAVYSIASTIYKTRLDFKIILPRDNSSVESIQTIWPAVNWYEREMWELYGVDVKNHGNLKRFLLPDDWDQGFPMRKDWDAPDFIRMPEY